ncbi:MAG: HU family DNA-binding protein [Clostridia bacterium]|nr:HU family DNA-binding protein [Clostridia bacterium]
MNKSNLVENVAVAAGIKKKEAELAVNSVLASLQTALSEGDKVQIAGFGTFKVKERKERTGKNPRTGEVLVVPAAKVPAFVPAKCFKEAVNK